MEGKCYDLKVRLNFLLQIPVCGGHTITANLLCILQLYNYSNADGKVIQTLESKIGFRRIKLVMNEGAWREPDGFPKTRSVPPAQLELNGAQDFLQGAPIG